MVDRKKCSISDLVGSSPAIVAVSDEIKTAAEFSIPVFITGETGTGKGLVAKIIHDISDRRDYPFIAVNCAAISRDLMENEFFGHEPGAFTGASNNGKPGIFELVEEGTIFLDELTKMPLPMQDKLLGVVQDKQYMKVGGKTTLHMNARIIAATDMYLYDAVDKGFLKDQLMYRLNVLSIHLPPLRERIGDKFVLTDHFLNRFQNKYKRYATLTDSAMSFINVYHWPGNIRELENTIEAVVVRYGSRTEAETSRTKLLDTHLKAVVHHPSRRRKAENATDLQGYSGTRLNAVYDKTMVSGNGHEPIVTLDNLHEFGGLNGIAERAKRDAEIPLIQMALNKTEGKPWNAAMLLGIGYTALVRKMKQYGINPPS